MAVVGVSLGCDSRRGGFFARTPREHELSPVKLSLCRARVLTAEHARGRRGTRRSRSHTHHSALQL